MQYSRKEQGFTLIELSIVLVIIGLLVGGVLAGRDLIQAAELRKTASEIQKLDTAIMAFKLKHNCLPGDCATASEQGLTIRPDNSVFTNGNGNGLLDTEDSWQAFMHLKNSNLYATRIVDDYASPLVLLNNEAYFLLNGSAEPFPGFMNVTLIRRDNGDCFAGSCPGITPYEAFKIDTKIDDGKPRTGYTRAIGPYTDLIGDFTDVATLALGSMGGPVAGAGGASAAVCISTAGSNNEYNLINNSSQVCALDTKLSQ